MAVNEKDIEWFDDVFNLSSEKKDDGNEQTEEYGHGTESSDSFKDLAKEVADDIKNSEDKGSSISGVKLFDHALTDEEVVEEHKKSKEDPHDILKSVCSDGVVDEIIKEEEDDDFFDDLPAQKEEVAEEVDKAIEVVDAMIEKLVECDDGDHDPSRFSEGANPCDNYKPMTPTEANRWIGQGGDQIEWLLDSPSSMYNGFYQKKRNLLFKYMVGGQIEYLRWTQELEDAQVIIKGEVFDHELIIRQMEAVQQHRERVKAIHVRVNNQYFTFKRFVEMMKGTLARIEYLKPVIRQEGLIFEHMRDLELYYARLEALHDSATKTEKTLEKAFDTLSRKCTICMELKAPERVDLKSKSTSYTPPAYISPVREKSSEFDEFDDLPSNAQAAPVGHKIGAIGWEDV